MKIRMLTSVTIQDAGATRTLPVESIQDSLPDGVAATLVAQGLAEKARSDRAGRPRKTADDDPARAGDDGGRSSPDLLSGA
jgi:hypothetical protein